MSGGTSTWDLYQTAFWERLWTTPGSGGVTIESLFTPLNGYLYIIDVPTDAAFPFGVMQLRNRRSSVAGIRDTADLEVLLYDRGFTNRSRIEQAADLCDQAMLFYQNRTGGGFAGGGGKRSRDSIRQYTDPADRELCVARCEYPVVLWPAYLTGQPTPVPA